MIVNFMFANYSDFKNHKNYVYVGVLQNYLKIYIFKYYCNNNYCPVVE